MYEIIPGILEYEWGEIEKKIEITKQFSNKIHIDIIDNSFSPNTTFLDPSPFKKYSQDIFFELHMMVDNPTALVESWGKAGIKRFLGHVERMDDQKKFLETSKRFGEVGLAIDGRTNINDINVDYEELDTLLIMTINAGSSGQEFMPDLLNKVKAVREKTTIPIEVDGGINDKTINPAREAGATLFVSTSYIFGSDDPKGAFENLSAIIKG